MSCTQKELESFMHFSLFQFLLKTQRCGHHLLSRLHRSSKKLIGSRSSIGKLHSFPIQTTKQTLRTSRLEIGNKIGRSLKLSSFKIVKLRCRIKKYFRIFFKNFCFFFASLNCYPFSGFYGFCVMKTGT